MYYTTDLDDTRGNPQCSLWIDLQTFPMPADPIAREHLGISPAQFAFALTPILEHQYPDSYTTLYYLHCSIQVPAYIPKTFAKVISAGYPHSAMERTIEDAFELPVLPKFDTHAYRSLVPEALVVSFPANPTLGERVIVHRNLTAGLYKVRYRYRGDLAYPLMKRLETLRHYSEAVVVSNASAREMLQIRS